MCTSVYVYFCVYVRFIQICWCLGVHVMSNRTSWMCVRMAGSRGGTNAHVRRARQHHLWLQEPECRCHDRPRARLVGGHPREQAQHVPAGCGRPRAALDLVHAGPQGPYVLHACTYALLCWCCGTLPCLCGCRCCCRRRLLPRPSPLNWLDPTSAGR